MGISIISSVFVVEVWLICDTPEIAAIFTSQKDAEAYMKKIGAKRDSDRTDGMYYKNVNGNWSLFSMGSIRKLPLNENLLQEIER